ncbi:TetR/AcrR family transcriptional regulator [Variovorax saccharolyticus]|uniref:TetR/AcrR family transcriptional regulator n=1 Tax=Variovorax saccharolyticus TaxID=3053516 RepID=UPI002577525D|nr:TetR/AcrR family transcriptional regulator [Variovorax sp. J22R187]MDM0020887.1 TetR/AcrR family transcriptional regulator [Variovorax sp. J22R187]
MRQTATKDTPASARREPRQARALQKVELILEAATRLLDKGDVESLTTNAVAEKAGVSIGTLYQYFDDKQAILNALVQREVDAMAAKAMASLTGPAPAAPGDRIRLIVRAVLGTYGGRARVHRMLMAHALGRGAGTRLSPLYAGIAELLTSAGVLTPDGRQRTMTPAEAFVLTHAIAGVLRGYVAYGAESLQRQKLEDALVLLAVRFLGVAA